MKQQRIRRLFGALVTAIALTLVLGAMSASAETHGGTPTSEDPCATIPPGDAHGSEASPSPEMEEMEMEAEFDLAFIDMMTMHHQSAISMAEVALARSTNEEIRTLAGEIIAAQAAEIEQMTEWRESWYPDAPMVSEGHAMEMMGMDDSGMMGMDGAAMLADLCDAEDVDMAFLTLMIPHHQGAIAMADAALDQAEHDELRDLAEAIVGSQSAEIALMQELLAGLRGTPTAQG